MTKKSTNFNQWRKAGNAQDVADLMARFGVTAAEFKAWAKQDAGTTRKTFACPRCGKMIETEVNNFDGSTTCPVCENDIVV